MRKLAAVVLISFVSLASHAQERLGAATKPHADAPPELAQLAFLVGSWKIHTTFTSADGTRRHTEAELQGSYILSGYGVQTVEVHTPDRSVFPEADSTFVVTTIFNYDEDNGKWSGASVNSLGNRKFVDGTFVNGKLVLIQKGKLFRGRQGQNRLTFFNITDDRFELQLDSYNEKDDSWSIGSYGYIATRVTP